jgi:hypothetical protein
VGDLRGETERNEFFWKVFEAMEVVNEKMMSRPPIYQRIDGYSYHLYEGRRGNLARVKYVYSVGRSSCP